MKKLGIAVLSAASLMAAGTAMAAEPQWTYLQAGWIQGDGFDDFGKTDGFEIKGSVGIENFHFGVGYVDGELNDDFDGDSDFDGYTMTVGYHQAITSSGNTQFVTDLSYFDVDFDFDGGEGSFSADNKGIGIGFGVRSVLNQLELEGMITYTRGEFDAFGGDDDYTDTGLRVGARYHWTPNFSTGVNLNINETTAAAYLGGDSAIFDIRWSFGDLMK